MKLWKLINKDYYRRWGKRIFDICVSSLLIILLAPLMMIIIIAIKITSKGPIIYNRKVLGLGGISFYAYKFRTMVLEAEKIIYDNPKLYKLYTEKHKLDNDFRVTKLGTFLRKYSLDEIPQLFNVLKGAMSLIGPRMIHSEELVKYGPHKDKLLSLKPSISGYWQVNGRQKTSYEERVQMDLFYIDNYCFTFDLWIMLLTPIKILRAEGAK